MTSSPDSVVGPIAGAIGNQIAQAASSDRVVQFIIGDRASGLIQDYLSEALGFGERPTSAGLEVVFVDQVAPYQAASSLNHLVSIGTSGSSITLLSGEDVIYGSAGSDTVYTGSGNDRAYLGSGSDIAYGGGENDDLRGEAGDDLLRGEGGNDTLYGGADRDYLYGDEGADYLKGEGGNDVLRGGTGNDRLFGDENDDRLIGEGGNDTLDGGSGIADRAVYSRSFQGTGSTFNYQITSLGNDRFTVRDLSNAEGTDTLERVEWITFGSDTRTIAQWITLAGGTAPTAPPVN